MPINISGAARAPVSIPPKPAGPVPTPYPNVAQAIDGMKSHGDSDSFQAQKDTVQIKQHGSAPASHGSRKVSFPDLADDED